MTLQERIKAEFDFPVEVEDFGRCVVRDLQGRDFEAYKYIVRSGDRYIECLSDAQLVDMMDGELGDKLFSTIIPFIDGFRDAVKC